MIFEVQNIDKGEPCTCPHPEYILLWCLLMDSFEKSEFNHPLHEYWFYDFIQENIYTISPSDLSKFVLEKGIDNSCVIKSVTPNGKKHYWISDKLFPNDELIKKLKSKMNVS